MFTRDSRILSHRLTTPLTAVANAVGDVFKPTYNQIIKSLFANNEQGFAYDPNDLTTMFQDMAGTIPVTAAGQPVGLMLDKSKGLLLGSNLANPIPIPEMLDAGTGTQGTWDPVTKTMGNIGASYTRRPRFNFSFPAVAGRFYKIKGKLSGNLETLHSVTPFIPADGSFSGIIQATGSVLSLQVVTDLTSTTSLRFEELSVQELPGNHAYQTTSASRPILRKNAVTGAYYLAFDGSDDFLVTSNIDFTSTDEVSLFAGVTPASSNAGILLETSTISTSIAGSFGLYAPHIGSNIRLQDFKSGLRAINSPNNSFVAGQYVLSAKLSQIKQVLRLNEAETSGTTSGAGNYGNYPLYIGRRGGTTLPFNGHIYGLIGIGRLTTDAETVALEKLIAKNTGVTLSV